MIVLDEHGVKEPNAMVRSATTSHRPLLQHPHTGNGLASIADGCTRPPRLLHVLRSERGNAGEMTHVIEERPFRCQDAP